MKPKGRWVCKQHGDSGCKTYVTSIVEEWNRKGWTPDNLPTDPEDLQFLKCLEWVEEGEEYKPPLDPELAKIFDGEMDG